MELKKDIGVGVVSIAIGAWVVFYTQSLRAGPAFFPRLAGIILMLVGAILAGISIMKLMKTKEKVLTEEEKAAEKDAWKKQAPSWRVFAVFGCLIAYYILIEYVGYTLPTFLTICAVAIILGYRKWKVLVPTSLLVSVGLYLAFTMVFDIKFPGFFY